MTPVEKLEAAIAKLEALRSAPQWSLYVGDWRMIIPGDGTDEDAEIIVDRVAATHDDMELIVTLHRTIDIQLNWLTDQVARMRVDVNHLGIPLHYRFAIALAEAILGDPS